MIQPRFSEAEPMEGDQELPLHEYEVHPVADLFPMLADDELADLAADIKAFGIVPPQGHLPIATHIAEELVQLPRGLLLALPDGQLGGVAEPEDLHRWSFQVGKERDERRDLEREEENVVNDLAELLERGGYLRVDAAL